MSGWVLLAALSTGLACALGGPQPLRVRPRGSAVMTPVEAVRSGGDGFLRRFRLPLAVLAGLAGISFVGGLAGGAVGVAAGSAVWVVATRAEPPAVRREREARRRGLPQVARLLAIVLESGQAVPSAFGMVAEALPGPASAPLGHARAALAVGVPAERVWAELSATSGLEPLGRALVRSAESGAGIADVVGRLADRLAAQERAGVEDRARTVGIRAAVPLGLCLLPAFLLLGIVPVVAAALSALQW